VGNIDATPTFVDAAGGNFHLLAGSAGIDGGDPTTFTPQGMLDLDGDPRSFGTAIDMGIDEFRKAGDADGVHLVDINDLLLVINTWGPCSWSTADFNGDFRVVIDACCVINGWGMAHHRKDQQNVHTRGPPRCGPRVLTVVVTRNSLIAHKSPHGVRGS
jgi:hypothetical protein